MMTATKKKPAKKKPAQVATAVPEAPKVEPVLVLRTCKSDMTSYNGFLWPDSGPIEATDWKNTHQCGNGLHGWLWGQGDYQLKAEGGNIWWLVLEVEPAGIVDLGGKVKFPKAVVIAKEKNWWTAMALIRTRRPKSDLIQIATGDYGHAAATGNSGHAAATGNSGHAACLAYNGRAKAAKNGMVCVTWWDEKSKRGRMAIGYVGEAEIKADTWYRASETGQLIEA